MSGSDKVCYTCQQSVIPSGAIAQLVERLLCKQNVLGSNPCGSTIFHFEISGLLAQLVRASC